MNEFRKLMEAFEATLVEEDEVYYHVTPTENVENIKQKGILHFQPSRWVDGEGNRQGDGEIFSMDDFDDAVRWAAKMDWDLHQETGSGKISIVTFEPDDRAWDVDDADPMSQAMNKGRWLKRMGAVKVEAIKDVTPVTTDLIRTALAKR